MDSYKLQSLAKSSLQRITTTSSDFNQFRRKGFLLVDKTAYLNDLIRESRVFLSRPRRFGKSLLLSTIAELFTNGVKNFEGLAIHDMWQRDRYPVVELSFFGLSDPETFESDLCEILRGAFAMAGFGAALDTAPQIDNIVDLTGYLDYLRGQQDIVLLIDECDFPLSSNLYDREAFEKNKEILNQFYAWIRDIDNLEFLMLTGIARYQDSSMFSGQTITDISMKTRYADLLGYTQEEVESYYASKKDTAADQPLSYGLNTTVVKKDGKICEEVWSMDGKYAKAIEKIVYWLNKASKFAENDKQRKVIETLIRYYKFGDLHDFNEYCIEWVSETESQVDFINGFIEVYDDPLGLKGTWEGLVEYRDQEGTRRTRLISDNAQWFEDNSPIDDRFKKKHVNGVSANVICAAMLGGGEYPSTAIGINLPNADWIRARYGSKSVTISNIIASYNEAGRSSGFKDEFVIDEETRDLISKYGDICDVIHTDLHECLGHGSGQLLPSVDPDALKAYGNTIEEARADLFGLYYIADVKLVDLGLLPDEDAYKAEYYSYIMNGMLTQLARIKEGSSIEEAHMRDRALIAHWCYEKGRDSNVIELVKVNDNTYVKINDYKRLRMLFAELLAEVQRIKSEGDFAAARNLVEAYGVTVNKDLHEEVLRRYAKLGIPPYKGFINPVLKLQYTDNGEIIDIIVDYTETYGQQMLRYSKEYSTLI